mgnify:CR=1 FL=1
MRYNGVVQRKLALLDNQLVRLESSLAGMDFEEFKASWEKRTLTERALQVAVEIVIDVAERIIAIEKAGPVATAAEAIECLVQLKILASASPYVDMVRFRNLIVHQYEEVAPEILFELATRRMGDFRAFRDEIDNLEKQ